MKGISAAGLLLFGLMTLCCLGTYGREWDLSGKYHMPTTLLAPDGMHYRDGTPVDAFSLVIAKSGYEQQVSLSIIGFVAAVLGFTMLRRGRARRREREETERVIRSHDERLNH